MASSSGQRADVRARAKTEERDKELVAMSGRVRRGGSREVVEGGCWWRSSERGAIM